jgi:hypothetical protein
MLTFKKKLHFKNRLQKRVNFIIIAYYISIKAVRHPAKYKFNKCIILMSFLSLAILRRNLG